MTLPLPTLAYIAEHLRQHGQALRRGGKLPQTTYSPAKHRKLARLNRRKK